ncbi:MAG: DUF547 domain-containing protein [Myxococcota bacterium]
MKRSRPSPLALARAAGLLVVALVLAGCGATRGAIGPAPTPAAGESPVFQHEDFDRFLSRHVDDAGRLAYAAAATDRADLDRYLADLSSASPDSHPERFASEADRLAYWINAYNASVIDRVLAHYPIESVQDVRGPWLARLLPEGAGFFVFETFALGGKRTRLYTLENALIRKRFAEPRIHFALNCASASCPRLPARAFRGETLEVQLARETRRFLAESRNVDIDPEAGVIRLSSIFDWYTKDFARPTGPRRGDAVLVTYLAQALDGAARRRLEACVDCRVEFVPYDWSLNDLPSVGG